VRDVCAFLERESKMEHQRLEERSLAMHRYAAAKIRANPGLFSEITVILANWRPKMSVNSLPYLEKWQALYDAGIEACLAVALEDSEFGREMRQSSPISCLLTDEERQTFLDHWPRDSVMLHAGNEEVSARYAAMATDEERESEAKSWSEGLIGDAYDELKSVVSTSP